MHAFLIICAAALGLIVGSFLNVVILRMNTGKGLGGRSMCLSCNRTLQWYELVPVFSFLIQKGKCRKCRSKISWQYPLVELTTGILFAGIAYFISSPWHMIILGILVSLGMVIAVYDIRHKMIPINPLIAFFIASLFMGIHVFGVLVPIPFLLLWIFSKGRWIGFGDIEIMAIMGLSLGFVSAYSAVFLGFWIACLVVIPLVIFLKKKRNSEIPLGPFLLFGMYLVAVCGLDVLNIILKMVY